MKPEGIIVLGNELVNGKLSKIAIDRLNKAIEIYSNNPITILLSGGYNISHSKWTGPTEASAMKEYLLKKGIPGEAIILEEDSRDTHANAYFTKKVVEKKEWKNIIVITSDVYVEKTSFFFDFIYGEGYNFDFIGVDTDFSDEEKKKIARYEKISKDKMKLEVYPKNNAKRGDDKKIKEIIDKFYARFEKGTVGLPSKKPI